MSDSLVYGPADVERILAAYRGIFPNVSAALADYWDWSRSRPWSYVTTDFRNATFAQFEALHEQTLGIDRLGLPVAARGEALRAAARSTGVGFSIGICPWTDNLLARTYGSDKDRVVILLGHDWYPIASGERVSGTPLMAGDSLHAVERYWPGAPEAVLDGSVVGLFVNLYPDYRPPGDPKCGKLSAYGYSYDACLRGLDALVAQVCQRFSHVQVISWGTHVWNALAGRVPAGSTGLLSAALNAAPGRLLRIELGGQVIPYLPAMHPSHWGNFGRPAHLRHVKAGYAALGLGLPGLGASRDGRVLAARTVNPA